ncbi:methionine ABC transporter ATP-binding protein [Malaciobacter mytili]|uniref:Cell division ATP-binding protein FtsE n=1 Tax=Malaciobacter mytili LMG 24559 TaxID=1032238 RepID=A0AAX2AI59_9BACT|nr:methionine ABC transporter ATP-binding protein [Malaciobacter mytili]AXH15328.1 DL-methionine ABC transporter MetINQ, ATP-binding protein [Malaciobacter mytili LMG 24559]RXI38190.1 methionine ABC transporter ATP-binding protein [Malaciobacter mytili]RXK15723.1 methionine ABC transporter ATP-binding protein [Malaciobacter mytili LMG 24559]
MIEIKNLNKYYGQIKVLNNINLSIDKGDIFAIVGHSGAGKSTLLRCINGLEDYHEGSLLVNKKEVKNLTKLKLREFRKNIGMIFQHFSLLQRKTVFENVSLPMELWGYSKDEIEKKVLNLLELVGLESKVNSYPKELSGGQKQRVAIARALTLDPEILLSDEATSALDPNTTTSILNLLKKINKQLNITIILVTHEMEVVKQIAQKALLLEHGNIIGLDVTEDLFLKPDEKMKHFLGEEEVVPKEGVNIKLYFPKDNAYQSLITSMARELDIDFSIVWGKLEEINTHIIGNMVINIKEEQKEIVCKYLENRAITWEILK